MVINIIKWSLTFRNCINRKRTTELVLLTIMQLISWRHVMQFESGCTHQTFLVCSSPTLEVFQHVFLKWTRTQNTQHVVQHGNNMECTLSNISVFYKTTWLIYGEENLVFKNLSKIPTTSKLILDFSILLHTFASISKAECWKISQKKASISGEYAFKACLPYAH